MAKATARATCLYLDNHARLDQALETLLDEGKTAGDVREEVEATDVILLLGALSGLPEAQWDARAGTLVTVILDGLRPHRTPETPDTT